MSPHQTASGPHVPKVVFACVRNGGRSVISRVLTEHYARGRVTALSAGTQPGERIHPEVAEALGKLGLDTSHEHPKLLIPETIAASDVAITLGCGEQCPYVPGVRYVDWPVDDPAGKDEDTVRGIIADLDHRVRALLRDLVPDIDLPASVAGHDVRPTGRQSVHDELERVRADLRHLVAQAAPEDLRRRTDGTRWTNQQMLFHLVFGYMIVRRLLPLVHAFGRLPAPFGRVFARVLDAGTRPFHVVNYLGSCGGALVFHGPRLIRLLDRTLDVLHRRLDAESDDDLGLQMAFPVRWDPFFEDTMTLAQVYHYGTRHYDFHRRQLTLDRTPR